MNKNWSAGAPKAVMELGWVNSRASWWRRILAGLDPVDLIGWMEWVWSCGALGAPPLTRFCRCNIRIEPISKANDKI